MYKPYNTILFPKLFKNIFQLFGLEKIFGENWKIKIKKRKQERGKLKDVIFKKY